MTDTSDKSATPLAKRNDALDLPSKVTENRGIEALKDIVFGSV